MRDETVRRLSALHRVIFRLTGGRIGKRLVDNDMLLLTTRGRRSGRPHTVPLLYLRDGERLAVAASFGGRRYHPAWYLNLSEDPVVKVRLADGAFQALATTAGPEDRARLWSRFTEAYHGYAQYQARTDREIPVVLLEPINSQRRADPG